jgi:PAS domain S-box-containing protein
VPESPGLTGFLEDLGPTDRDSLVAALERAAFEHSPIGIGLIGVSGGRLHRFVVANRALCAITGRNELELLAVTLDELILDEDRGADAVQRERLLGGTTESFSVEQRLRHLDGTTIWAQLGLSVAPASNGGPPEHVIVHVQDISDRRRLEDHLGEPPGQDRGRGPGLSRSEIRAAIEDGRLALCAQPILDLRTGGVEREELLLRMWREDGELVGADRLIGPAERYGLVQELDRWVVREAIGLIGDREVGERSGAVHVNLSAASVIDVAVVDYIEEELDHTGADPRRLAFEITETAATRNFERACTLADRLLDLGCSIAIDDYGTGFGSFYYLKRLPFDLLKIDGDFVCDLGANDADRLTVEAIVRIASGLGKQTIAEFVESEETLAILRELGVDMAQGFHVGVPALLD